MKELIRFGGRQINLNTFILALLGFLGKHTVDTWDAKFALHDAHFSAIDTYQAAQDARASDNHAAISVLQDWRGTASDQIGQLRKDVDADHSTLNGFGQRINRIEDRDGITATDPQIVLATNSAVKVK